MVCVYGEEKKKSLQIGIKKRVDADKCLIKSTKGDKLEMHYTVMFMKCIIHKCLCLLRTFCSQ